MIEAMLLVMVIGLAGVGYGVALQACVRAPKGVDQALEINTRLVEKMEDLLTLDFTTLSTSHGLSDTVVIGNTNYSRTVTVLPCDADNNGSADPDFLEITVTIDSRSLKTRVTQP